MPIETLPTVRIQHHDHPTGVLINQSDFDEDVHVLHADHVDAVVEKKALSVAEMRAELGQRGIAIPDGAKKADLRALLDT